MSVPTVDAPVYMPVIARGELLWGTCPYCDKRHRHTRGHGLGLRQAHCQGRHDRRYVLVIADEATALILTRHLMNKCSACDFYFSDPATKPEETLSVIRDHWHRQHGGMPGRRDLDEVSGQAMALLTLSIEAQLGGMTAARIATRRHDCGGLWHESLADPRLVAEQGARIMALMMCHLAEWDGERARQTLQKIALAWPRLDGEVKG